MVEQFGWEPMAPKKKLEKKTAASEGAIESLAVPLTLDQKIEVYKQAIEESPDEEVEPFVMIFVCSM